MVRKLNRKAAEAYSKTFSSKVMDDFFSNRQVATGQDILELTPVQQVNLLLVQRLYVRWQEDTLRLRSPYFNYEHPQVKEALQQFMNTLSRHIQVERPALQPLLEEAVLDSLRLLLQPMAYIDELIHRYPENESLQASLRYLRWQDPLCTALQEQLEQKEITDGEYLLALLDAGLKSGRLELDAVDEHIQAFEQVHPMPLELIDEPAKEQPVPPKEEAPADFFSAIARTPRPSRPALQPEPQPEPLPIQEAAPAANPQPQPEAPKFAEPAPAPTPVEPVVKAPVVPELTVATAPAESSSAAAASKNGTAPKKGEEEAGTLNKRFERNNDKKPLYEKFEQKETKTPLVQKPRSASIRNYITLNQRFMFVKELFGGDGGAFNAALDTLDSCQNRQEAQQWVDAQLAQKPHWQDEADVVQEFRAVLDHRFGS